MRIELPSGTPATVARPEGSPRRALVIVPDMWGLRPLFDDMCADLAGRLGWAVAAVEPFPGQELPDAESRFAALKEVDDRRLLADVAAAADVLGAGPVAVAGFCMGGMYALKAAGEGRYDRAVSFYGMIRVPEAWRGPGQGEPLDALGGGGAGVLAIIGEDDPWTPAADIDALEAAGATVVRYPGADHGFVHDPSRPAHRPDDAADAWRRVEEFLAVG
jgi:carboxymethylenebutenolidase